MRYGSLKAKRKTSSPDRKIIIGIVVITSALSFILGYFVGGAGEKGKQPHQIAATKLEIAPQTPQPAAVESQVVSPAKDLSPNGTDTPVSQITEEKAPSEKTPVQPAVKKTATETKVAPKIESDAPKIDLPYTVQAGAFKNLKEAEALKRKLEAKGYKAYIKKYAKSKNSKLYKVRTGEFASKEEAAEVALKLKNEGLKAFATTKNEKQEARKGK